MTLTHPTTCFGLLRHAETVFNREKRIQGHGDSPLTPEGRRQAAQWARVLAAFDWNRMLVSDLGRAVLTAEIINAHLNLPLVPDARLREQDWGRWSGRRIARIRRQEPEMLAVQQNAGWDFCPPEGESRRAVLSRSRRALEEAAARWAGDRLLVVTHEGVVKCLLYHLLGRKFLPSEPAVIKSGYLHRLAHTPCGLRLEVLNATFLSGN